MGIKYSKSNNNENMNELLLAKDYNSSSSSNYNLESIIYEINNLKEEHKKLIIELKNSSEKNYKLEQEINKIQNNYGQEIYKLNEHICTLQIDSQTLLNNQKIISEVLQNISSNNISLEQSKYKNPITANNSLYKNN
jgi:hypothetical protein